MKKEFLKGLGIEDSVIDKILESHNTAIDKQKQSISTYKDEVEGLKNQLTEANTQIQSFKDMDVDGIKQSAEDWKVKYETTTQELNDKLKAKDYEYNAKDFLGQFKFSSERAKMSVLEEFKSKNFTYENGKFLGGDEYINQLKESDPGAFIKEEDTKMPTIVKPTGGSPAPLSNNLQNTILQGLRGGL
ncbi:MAG: phage scaffolding protein [Paraclostridium sp.]